MVAKTKLIPYKITDVAQILQIFIECRIMVQSDRWCHRIQAFGPSHQSLELAQDRTVSLSNCARVQASVCVVCDIAVLVQGGVKCVTDVCAMCHCPCVVRC